MWNISIQVDHRLWAVFSPFARAWICGKVDMRRTIGELASGDHLQVFARSQVSARWPTPHATISRSDVWQIGLGPPSSCRSFQLTHLNTCRRFRKFSALASCLQLSSGAIVSCLLRLPDLLQDQALPFAATVSIIHARWLA